MRVTFDTAIPLELHAVEDAARIYWDTAVPLEGGFAVRTQDFLNLVIEMATVAVMQGGGAFRSGIAYDPSEGLSQKAVTCLQNHLEKLTKPA